MPYSVRKRGDKFVVITRETGKVHGTFDSKAAAMRQLRALYANADPAEGKAFDVARRDADGNLHPIKALRSDETLAYLGGAVKALGGGKLGGIVVPFGTPDSADCQGDFFTPATDFGLDVAPRARVVYHHGFTKSFGPRKLGVVGYGIGATGLEITDGQLDLADPDIKALYGKAERGELFFSSGSAERLVVRHQVRPGIHEVKSWPILEISLTPNPVDRRARAFAVKALFDEAEGEGEGDPDSGLDYDDSGRDSYAAAAALRSLADCVIGAICCLMHNDGPHADLSAAERLTKIRAEFQDFSDDGLGVVRALFDDYDEDAAKAILGHLDTPASKGSVAGPTLAERSDRLVADLAEIAGLYRKAHEQRQADGRSLTAAKRNSIKSVCDALTELLQATDPRPDPQRLLKLRLRLAQGQFEAASDLY